jgi:predicted ATPase/class 3 adenylate cyclase
MGRLPEGTVTFLFSDVAGSTRLVQELGEGYADVLLDYRKRLREVFSRHRGVEVDSAGDAFFVAFSGAVDAARAALDVQEALRDSRIRVRVGVHTGEPTVAGDGYVGIDVHRAARISSAAHGGQVVVSERTRSLLADDTDVTDLGQHRLKDLVAPEHLFQLGPGEFPPLRSLNATNLPEQASPLIGRTLEILEIAQLLAERRVVTLTGPGGTGKTRLAIQAAAEVVERFPDGVFWIPIAAIEDASLVPPAIADAIGAGHPVAEHIEGKRLLAVLDNLEQVLDAAPYLSSLVESCPHLRLLVTSRAPLRIAGEKEYAVAPLPADDALALFRERAFDTTSSEVGAEICRRVDRLPLAVELAAARTRLFTPEQLLARLEHPLPMLRGGRRDAPARHRDLRDTIAWSYRLLEPDAQRLFERLGVFAGSFDLEAAEAVAEGGLDEVALLAEASLIRTDQGRFAMLETIREYAVERLEASGEAAEVRDRHLRYYLEFAERGETGIKGPELDLWETRFEDEEDNLRAALSHALDGGAASEALRLCSAMSFYWQNSAHTAEGLVWSDRALEKSSGVDPAVRARALVQSAWLLLYDNRPAESVARAHMGVAEWRTLPESTGLAEALLGYASSLSYVDVPRACAVLEEASEVSARVGFERGKARALHTLGDIYRDEGDFDAGARHLEQSLEVSTRNGWRELASATTHSLGDLELDRGDLDRARSLYRDCLHMTMLAGVARNNAYCVAGLAAVAAREGDTERAAQLWAGFEAAEVSLSFRMLPDERERYERCVAGVPPWEGPPLDLDEAARLALTDGAVPGPTG